MKFTKSNSGYPEITQLEIIKLQIKLHLRMRNKFNKPKQNGIRSANALIPRKLKKKRDRRRTNLHLPDFLLHISPPSVSISSSLVGECRDEQEDGQNKYPALERSDRFEPLQGHCRGVPIGFFQSQKTVVARMSSSGFASLLFSRPRESQITEYGIVEKIQKALALKTQGA